MTEQEIVDTANDLARTYYHMMGYIVTHDFKFYNAIHPQEKLCWDMAVCAFEILKETDVENALSSIC